MVDLPVLHFQNSFLLSPILTESPLPGFFSLLFFSAYSSLPTTPSFSQLMRAKSRTLKPHPSAADPNITFPSVGLKYTFLSSSSSSSLLLLLLFFFCDFLPTWLPSPSPASPASSASFNSSNSISSILSAVQNPPNTALACSITFCSRKYPSASVSFSSAISRSTLLISSIILTFSPHACRITVIVCGHTPSTASTTTSAPSLSRVYHVFLSLYSRLFVFVFLVISTTVIVFIIITITIVVFALPNNLVVQTYGTIFHCDSTLLLVLPEIKVPCLSRNPS
ncbi:hypothetical protein AX774_g611 [Zancudomyces culisetae]|uniref:Uncharacterized protein n=1 Tax=Zancudomyces culisetae TaxID=1213189 RepID=A0A1R1PXY3_ZANCU|nr:hypothetical protein AX774_g611 [Zancudomyces culisetae]|eukprot:OMH85835.1 hypothetical protein AX774_g611 [Zancudomyces culisetae]